MCKHMFKTNKKFTGCKSCNAKQVICLNPKICGKRRNGNLCNEKTCKYFENDTK
jgi:hypothetical protein